MGLKKFVSRKIPITNRQRNSGVLPVSHPLPNSASNQIQHLISTPNEGTVPPIFIDQRPAASTVSFSFDGLSNSFVAPFSPVHAGGSPSSSSSSTSSGKGADWSSGSSGSSMPGPNRVSYRRPIPAFKPGPVRPHIIDIPVNEKREQLIREYIRAHKYWWWGFAVDGVVLTCLESCMDLGKTYAKALLLCVLYISFFPMWLVIVVDRRSVVERFPTRLEVMAGIMRMAYLFALRGLFLLYGVSSSNHVLAYFVFKCVALAVIKYLSAFATLVVIEQKFKLELANLDADGAPAPAPAPHLVD